VAEAREGSVFTGKYEHSLDEANRLVMPAKLRPKLEGTLFLTCGKGKHPHLVLLPGDEYQRFKGQLRGVDPFGDTQDDIRDMFSDAEEVVIDTQGRLSVPTSLRAAGGLQQKVIVLGAFNRVEIWDRDTYSAYRRERGRPG
jgi:MraZ protein